MARISLRDYNREIEELVDSGRTDEAIAHCRYILETYPKHVTTYRSMGKALLESQRYGDAADVFKRVLACIPDDFISHLGMSIIREDEGDLEGSIWHMERAFEVQPSNAAVQSELRRLYGRRDGLTPAKVQLTRGAMARMSAKSNLYSQAIAELRTALADDPERPDLQALLARMYAQSGQRLTAIEACNTLLGKFPYCLEANRLMAEILPGTERAAEAGSYRQRLEELDPYESHLSPAAETAELVPAGAITLERLDYLDVQSPIEAPPAQPQWASSLGVSIEQTPSGDEPVPDWLSTGGELPEGAEQAATQGDLAGGEIPEWMRESGWEPASAEAAEESLPGFEAFEAEAAGTDELASAEIPDWLQDLAPVEEAPETTAAIEAPDVGKTLAGAAVLANELDENPLTPEEAEISGAESLPESGAEIAEVESASAGLGAAGAAVLGGAVAAGAILLGGDEEEQPAGQPEAQESETPDWITQPVDEGAGEPAEELTPVVEEALPDWLEPVETPSLEDEGLDLTAAAGLAAAAGIAAVAGQDEVPLAEEPGLEIPAVPQAEIPPLGVAEWLAESAAEAQAELPIEEETADSVPEWLAKLSPEESLETAAEGDVLVSGESPEQEAGLAKAEIPQWLREMESGTPAEPIEAAQPVEEQPTPVAPEEWSLETEAVPDWLKAAMAAEAVGQVIESEPGEPEPFGPPIIEGDTKPVRLRPAEEEVAIAEAVEVTADETEPVVEELVTEEAPTEMAVEETPELEEGVADGLAELAAASALIDESPSTGFESEDEAMAWLEGLAARQGALEEELLTKPEERPVETPDWIQQYAGEAAEEVAIPEEEIPQEDSHVLTDISKVVAAGLIGKEILDREEVAEEPQAAVPETAEWLPEATLVGAALVEETLEPIETEAEGLIEAEMEAQEQPASEDVELPDWLRGLEAEAEEATPEIVAGGWTPPEEFAEIATVAALAGESPRLDINTASLAQLERIPGIGFITAQSIVAYREVNGPFTSLDQLQEIPGIPPETYDDINRQLYVEAVAEAAPAPSRIPELAQAWQHVVNGNTPAAVEQYTHYIREKQELDEIIAEINEALQLYPLDPLLYQTLGDAYLRADRLPEAMDAYNHAEDLIK